MVWRKISLLCVKWKRKMRRNFKLFPVETENKNSGFSCSTWIGLRPLQFATIYANSVVEPAIASHKNPFRTICKIEEKR